MLHCNSLNNCLPLSVCSVYCTFRGNGSASGLWVQTIMTLTDTSSIPGPRQGLGITFKVTLRRRSAVPSCNHNINEQIYFMNYFLLHTQLSSYYSTFGNVEVHKYTRDILVYSELRTCLEILSLPVYVCLSVCLSVL